jgi:hypothetical protein
LTKPITKDSINKEKYNMVPIFCQKNLTPAIKPIVLIVTNQVQELDLEAAHHPTPSYHRRRRRHTGL